MFAAKNDAEDTCPKTIIDGGNTHSTLAPSTTIDIEKPANNPTTDSKDEDQDFPEGGLRAWLGVFGSFCAMFMVFGIVNSTGAFQDYFSSHQLRDYSPDQIGWIFSLYLFLVFLCGIYTGVIFDAHGPKAVIAVGSVAMVLSMMLLSFCTGAYPRLLTTST